MKDLFKKLYVSAMVACGAVVAWYLLYDASSNKPSTSLKTIIPTHRAPASVQKVEKSTVSQAVDEKTKKLLEIAATQECYNSESCDFSKADPRSYEIELGHKLASQIKEFHQTYKNDPGAKADLLKLAREHFKNENGFVQEAALNILKDFPQEPETLETLREGLKDNHNPLIAEMVLPELKKFLGTPQEDQVHETLDEMARGAHFVSQTATENILDFINPRSYDHYKKLLSQLHPRSKAYKNLSSALREYERRQIGG